MELLLRVLVAILTLAAVIVNTLLAWLVPRKKPSFPPIRNKLLTLSIGELVIELRSKKLTSEQLVQVYIDRVKQVNASLNAVVEDRFQEALKEAQHADQLIAKATGEQLLVLFARYPLLGIPCTIKESCGVKGMSLVVGNVHRMHERSRDNGEVVELLRSAGCIPLLVSANPEFCMSLETSTHTNGRCKNPYDLRRTTAGSSGGEGALNSSGASVFGLGSDIGGSIRLPAMFSGVFGHKCTGNLVSTQGHFPNSQIDPEFPNYLQLGPMTRFARDMPLLLQIMAGNNVDKLKFSEGVKTKDIQIHYAYGFEGLNGWTHPPVDFEIKLAIQRAVMCFEKAGLKTKEFSTKNLRNSLEICLSAFSAIKGVPSIISQSTKTRPTLKVLTIEFIRSLFGHSLYTKDALFMEIMHSMQSLIRPENMEKYQKEAATLRQEITDLLGTNGVIFFPTFHAPALHFNTALINLVGIDMLMLFNILGLPTTHVPMGLDRHGMPTGFQVIAAPYQDKLCLHIAAELEGAFGGWTPQQPNEI